MSSLLLSLLAITGFMMPVAKFIEARLRVEAKQDVAKWISSNSLIETAANGSTLVKSMLDTFFGPRLLSLRSLLCSAGLSTFFTVGMWLLLFVALPAEVQCSLVDFRTAIVDLFQLPVDPQVLDVSHMLLLKIDTANTVPAYLPIGMLVLVFVIQNVVFDYISLTQTRIFINIIERCPRLRTKLGIIVADFFATLLLAFASLVVLLHVSFWYMQSTYESHFIPTMDAAIAINEEYQLLADEMELTLHRNIQKAKSEYAMEMAGAALINALAAPFLVHGDVHLPDISFLVGDEIFLALKQLCRVIRRMGVGTTVLSPFVYATFLTSLWLYIYSLSLLAAVLANKGLGAKALFVRCIDIEKYPLTSLTGLAVAVTWLLSGALKLLAS